MTGQHDGRAGAAAEVAVAAPAMSSPLGSRGLGVPLTERILSRLPGPRLPWMVIWALVPWLNLVAVYVSGAAEWAGTATIPASEVLNRAAVTGAILLSLWGAARITDDLRRVGIALTEVVEQDERDVRGLFRGVDSTVAPLLLTAVGVLVLPLDEALTGAPLAALIQGATWVIIGIPLWTAIWVYLRLQRGFDRLGRGHLTLLGYRGDRSLGLRPVGRLAFTGFWMLVGSVGPLVLTNASDPPGVILGVAVLAVGVGLFFLSLRRLNRRMVAVKQREITLARELYMQAYEKVRDQPTLEVLQGQVGLLNAAEALEKRAERIQEWPFDDATFARVVTIASSAAATIIARFLLDPIGL
jgi:energy-converting hydrogenase Eha subunit E